MDLVQRERATYEQIWGIEAYHAHSPGETNVPLFLEMTQTTMRGSVLDAGCGSGKGAVALQAAGFNVHMCDLTDIAIDPSFNIPFTELPLWADLKRKIGFKDWVYCCDVMEHIPAPFAMLVVQRLLEVARRGVFFSIALVPDHLGVWVGKSLHQNVQVFTEWRDQLSCLATIKESRDLLTHGLFLLEPHHAQ